MAKVERSSVTLRISGDDLFPDEITALLGTAPTYSQIKGEKLGGQITRIAKFGMWSLRASDHEPEDMNGQIKEVLGQISYDLAVWREIASKYEADLFCGLFLNAENEGLVISAESLAALGSRGIKLELDIYSGEDDEDES